MNEGHAPVSVIVPCYKAAETLERAVRSVAAQTRLPSEVVLIDDGSPDDGATVAAMKRAKTTYRDRFDVRLVFLPGNRGCAAARNAGWEKAGQEWLAFLDADDAWHPRKLEVQMAWLKDHPGVALTGHLVDVASEDDPWPGLATEPRASRIGPRKLLLSNRFSTPTIILRRDLPNRFHEDRLSASDFLLWSEVVLDGHEAWRIEMPLARLYKARWGVSGISSNLWQMERGELANYRDLQRSGRINWGAAKLFSAWSILKFSRRAMLAPLRRRAKGPEVT